MDQHELEQRSKQKAQVAASDPLTVIDQAKKSLYQGGGQPDPWIEEVVSRFDAQTRATLGSSAPVFMGAGSSS